MNSVIPFVLLWALVTVCDGQGMIDTTNARATYEVCRKCPECTQVEKLDGGCPGCICEGKLHPDCPNVTCPIENELLCARYPTIDGCEVCVCEDEGLEPQNNNDELPETVTNTVEEVLKPEFTNDSLPEAVSNDEEVLDSQLNNGMLPETITDTVEEVLEPEFTNQTFPETFTNVGEEFIRNQFNNDSIPETVSNVEEDLDPQLNNDMIPGTITNPVEELLKPQLNNDSLPETVTNIGEEFLENQFNSHTVTETVSTHRCSLLFPCAQHCQRIDQTGCPVCVQNCEKDIFAGSLPDAIELCPPIPICPVGCIDMEHKGEFDCFECNCTLPELESTSNTPIGGFNPVGNSQSNEPDDNPADPTVGLPPSEISPFDAGTECGETECREGCRLCIGRVGGGKCLCGSDSVICPAFPRCPASCITHSPDKCPSCACAPESLEPELQSGIINTIPTNLQSEFVSDLPPALSTSTFTDDGVPIDLHVPQRRTQNIPLRIISSIISQFTPNFISNLGNIVRTRLAMQCLSVIKPRHRPQLSLKFIAEVSPDSLFRAPRLPSGFNPQDDNIAGASFGFGAPPVNKPQGLAESQTKDKFVSESQQPHSQMELASNPAFNTHQQRNPLSTENVRHDSSNGVHRTTGQNDNPRNPVQTLRNRFENTLPKVFFYLS